MDYLCKMISSVGMYMEVCVEIPIVAQENERRIYLIPGIKGCNIVFKPLKEYIRSPVTSLQLGLKRRKECNESVVDAATALLAYVLSSNEGKKIFTLVDYSFRAILAIELARMIETKGFSAQLILIDGAPDQLKLLHATILTDDEVENQIRFLKFALSNVKHPNETLVDEDLRKSASWKEKLQKTIGYLKSVESNTDRLGGMLEKLFDVVYRRLIAVKNYDISNQKPIKSSITLLRATVAHFTMQEKDYDLTKASDDSGEEVVISGMAGRFPGSANVKEFAENLYNKKLLTTTEHTRHKSSDQTNMPPALGVVKGLEKFDAIFFGVSYKLANLIGPQSRVLLEHTFEALLDAGINPNSLRGGNTGVFIGACFTTQPQHMQDPDKSGLGLIGCSRAMLANRISFTLDVHGPSISVDTACSSSLAALELAYKAIMDGECDYAIVGGGNICTDPLITKMFSELGVLTMGETCRCFDNAGNGYVRAETIGVMVLQKAKSAKRVYATVVHAKSNNDGYKPHGITHPSYEPQFQLLKQTYQECGVSPTDVSYVEAHATATIVGDPIEVRTLDEFFSPGRSVPLKIGSVKSNMGHAEGASGIGSIVKVIYTMENSLIPPNINYDKPRKGLDAIEKGRLQVVTEPTPWDGGYIGINGYGFGGSNVHVILKPNPKLKRSNLSKTSDLPILVFASGRTQEAVESFLNDVENRAVDTEYIRLLHDVFADNISGHLYRGYTVTNLTTDEGSIRAIDRHKGDVRPVWFIFSGMGAQWPGMGTSLMRLPVFAEAIQRCDLVLRPRGVDIMDVLTNTDERNFDDVLRCFVGITAVQIGLVDLLKIASIVPDKMVGHSLGELACAYADGSLTAEETILASYSRGLASIETDLIHGSMAAVGLGYNQVKDLCPSDIEVACHNGPNSSTISGPADSMKAFVAQLQAKGIFIKEVPCGGIAYHSRYIAPAGKKLLNYLRDIIKDPKPRSEKWLSTSVPRAEWSGPASKLSSAEYFTNNLLNPVLFEETAALIPENAITIEIAPHGLMQAILKRSLGPAVVNVALTKRGYKDNIELVLQGLGKIYNAGIQPQVAKLYPEIKFPVSRGTPMISPLVKWEHSEDWPVLGNQLRECSTLVKTIDINLSNDLGRNMIGHVIDGRHLVPATAYILLVWDVCCEQVGKALSVDFEDVMFNRATIIPEKGNLQLTVTVETSTGMFYITESDEAVATGTVRIHPNSFEEEIPAEYLPEIDEPEEMNEKDVYKELKLRGYQYSGMFRGIKTCSITGVKGHVAWNNNWVSFLDTILQLHILQYNSRDLMLPTGIKKLLIDIPKHEEALQTSTATEACLQVTFYTEQQAAVCGGVVICNVTVSQIQRHAPNGIPVLEEYKFVPYRDLEPISLFEALSLFVHVALENIHTVDVQTIEFIDDRDNLQTVELVSPLIIEFLGNIPVIRSTPLLITSHQFEEKALPENIAVIGVNEMPQNKKALIAFGHDLLSKDRVENLKRLTQVVQLGGFLASLESGEYSIEYLRNLDLNIVMEKRVNRKTLLLLKKKSPSSQTTVVIHLSNNEFSWIEDVKETLNVQQQNDSLENLRLVLVGEGFENGLLGFVNCLRRELGGKVATGMLIQDSNAPVFSLDNPFYQDQLALDLAVNVLRGNVWGTYRHLPLPPIVPRLVPHATSEQKTRGNLSSFSWMEGPLQTSEKDNIYVSYSALNFRDVMLATGKLQQLSDDKGNVRIGFEFSGVDAAGRRVMGLAICRAFANITKASKTFLFAVPDKWTLEEAATIPCVYATCYYAFYVIGKIKRGDKILIHAGSGAIGQAAIHLALHEGCEVFTTVGTPEKRKFIKETFPSIDDAHIGNSRDTSFARMVLCHTKGRGVDVVLNSLATDKLQASIRCLAYDGQFLEIGKYDITLNNNLKMGVFAKRITFRPVFIDHLVFTFNEESQSVAHLIRNGIENGVVKPLVRTVFERDQMETAFRYMAAGKHIGKVLIKIRNEGDSLNMRILAHPQYYCKKDGSYVIFGGLGGFGLELANWLILRGARNLVLVSRNGINNGYQSRKIKFWESSQIKVIVITGKSVTSKKDIESVLRIADKLGPIDGVFNLVVSLMDAIYINQTTTSFEESFKGKAWLTKILDELTRKLCPHLRHFVVFSSVSCGRGNAGQTNYGMSNSVMERICEKRMQDGLPGLAVQWGAVGDVGLVADMQVDGKELVIGGTLQQAITSCLEELDGFLQRNCPIVSSMVVAEKSASARGAKTVVEAVQSIMRLNDLERLNLSTTLPELGMDSMTVVEIKETLEREFNIFLTPQQIRGLTFAKLQQMSEGAPKHHLQQKKNIEPINMGYLWKMIGTAEMYLKVSVEIPTIAEANRRRAFLIPGIEGCSIAFQALKEHIKSPVTCLQVDLKRGKECHESVVDTATALLPYVLSSNEGKKIFTLVGYSFGAILAIELARMIEAKGFSAQLILIDGAPDPLKLLHATMLTDNEVENQIRFLKLGLSNVKHPNETLVDEDLRKSASWKEKLQKTIGYLKSTESNTDRLGGTLEKLLDVLYRRIIAVKNYDISNQKPIKSSITLLRATVAHFTMQEKDYGLGKVTEGTVDVHVLQGDHSTILENVKIAHVINSKTIDRLTV